MERYLKLLCSLRNLRGELKQLDASALAAPLDEPKKALLTRELKWTEDTAGELRRQLAALPSKASAMPVRRSVDTAS